MAGSLLESRLPVQAKKGLTAAEVIHKAEKKYEVVKVTDEKQANRRKLNAILNKLTPQNITTLSRQVVIVVNEVNAETTLVDSVAQIYERALMEPIFCEVYVEFCWYLSSELPDILVGNKNVTFKRVLLNKIQEEFERGEKEREEDYRVDDGEMVRRKEEREEEKNQARCRMLVNIRLIGELYKKNMLTERIMHECIKKLLSSQRRNPNEEDIVALCTLIGIIGKIVDHPIAKPYMDAYFDTMSVLSDNVHFSPRVRFMLKDAVDLRKNNWRQRREVGRPKEIAEIHREAVQKWQTQANLLAFGLGINASVQKEPQTKLGRRVSKSSRSGSGFVFGGNPSPPQQPGY